MKGFLKNIGEQIQTTIDSSGNNKEYGISDFQKTDWTPSNNSVISLKSILTQKYLRSANTGLPRSDAFQKIDKDTWWTLEFAGPPPLPSLTENDKNKFYLVNLKSVSSGNYLYATPGSTRVLCNKDTKPNSSWRLRKSFEKNEGEDKKKLTFLFAGWELYFESSMTNSAPGDSGSLCVDSTKQVILQNISTKSPSVLWEITDCSSVTRIESNTQALLEVQPVSIWYKKWVSSGVDCKYGDVTFLRPSAGIGFYFLSDYIERGANEVILKLSDDASQSLISDRNEVVVVKDISQAQNLLLPPVDYELVWSSAKCKLDFEITIWKPIPPSSKVTRGGSYVSLGYIVVTGSKKPSVQDDPNLALYRCVHSSCVVPGIIRFERDGGCIWQDVGTGAKRDLALWKVRKVPVWEEGWSNGSGSGRTVGGFVGVNSYTRPIEPVWCLNDDVIEFQEALTDASKSQAELKSYYITNNNEAGQPGYKLTRETVKWYNNPENLQRLVKSQRIIKKALLRKRFSEVVRNYRTSDKSAVERHRVKVATELYTTEVSYFCFIKQLVDLKRSLILKYATDMAQMDKNKKAL